MLWMGENSMKEKNGFISTALVYTFFILFLVLMVFIINSYSNNRYLLSQYKIKLEEELSELNSSDINLYVCAREKDSTNCDYDSDINDLISHGYELEELACSKLDGSPVDEDTISGSLNGNKITIQSTSRGSCFAYFEKE